MLVVTFITGILTDQMKKQAKISGEQERRSRLLYEINQKLLAAGDRIVIAELPQKLLGEPFASSVDHVYQDIRRAGGVERRATGTARVRPQLW